jgi:hypothetical protein
MTVTRSSLPILLSCRWNLLRRACYAPACNRDRGGPGEFTIEKEKDQKEDCMLPGGRQHPEEKRRWRPACIIAFVKSLLHPGRKKGACRQV